MIKNIPLFAKNNTKNRSLGDFNYKREGISFVDTPYMNVFANQNDNYSKSSQLLRIHYLSLTLVRVFITYFNKRIIFNQE